MWWAYLLLAAILCAVYRYLSWRHLRHIPSPPSLPLLGHLLDIQTRTMHGFIYESFQKYGPVFTLWWGSRPFVVVCDAMMARKVMQRCHIRTMLPAPFRGNNLSFYNEGLVFANHSLHKLLRSTWAPHFLPAVLATYHPVMLEATQQLLSHLEEKAVQGAPFDVHRYASCMTMEVVGRAAFGVEINAYEGAVTASTSSKSNASSPSQQVAQVVADSTGTDRAPSSVDDGRSNSSVAKVATKELLAAFRAVFTAAQPSQASVWVALYVMLPVALSKALAWLAEAVPDKSWHILLQAHEVIRRTSLQLIHTTAATAATAEPESNGAVTSATASKAGQGSSFIRHMLGARDKSTGAPLAETSMVSNVASFLAAGYETSANTLAYCIYHVCRNPEVEAKLLKEVDSFGPDWVPTMEDLDKLPYTTAVIDESMRLTAAASYLFREAHEPINVGPYQLPAATKFFVSLWSAHRDPKLWRESDRFVPERFLPGHPEWAAPEDAFNPFGGGQRQCVGYKFAYLELKLALALVYRRFTFRLSPADLPLQLSTGIVTSPDNGIAVTVHAR